MRTCAECLLCLLNRELECLPEDASTAERTAYYRDVLRLLADADPTMSTPELSMNVIALYRQRFGKRKEPDYASLKKIYNRKLLDLEATLRQRLQASPDPLAYALKLARIGNYIDFGGRHQVKDSLLDELIEHAENDPLNAHELERLTDELSHAKQAVYLADNAGELVADKLLLELLMQRYPSVTFTLIVRGEPTLNDATMDDARDVGLTDRLRVVGNGNGIPGTVWRALTDECRALLTDADVVIAKGQANFETLCGCGLNVYYLLLCKCELFMRRFQAPRLTGLFVNERRMPAMER